MERIERTYEKGQEGGKRVAAAGKGRKCTIV